MKPMLFNTEMVKAILEGRKTCTRRLVKPAALRGLQEECRAHLEGYTDEEIVNLSGRPYYPGDVLYVRETWFEYAGQYVYKASAAQPELWDGMWKPSIHMPKEAARIFLRVKNVYAERLQKSFSEPIAPIFAVMAEGVDVGETCRTCIEAYGTPCCVDEMDDDGTTHGECGLLDEARGDFSDLWDITVKPAAREHCGWAANPWVWVIEFERIEEGEAK